MLYSFCTSFSCNSISRKRWSALHEVTVFDASILGIPWFSFSNISTDAYSQTHLITLRSFKLPFVLIISLLKQLVTAFPIIRRIPTPMSIGLSLGFLFSGIALQSNKSCGLLGSTMRFVHMTVFKGAIGLVRSAAEFPKILLPSSIRISSASEPDITAAHLVLKQLFRSSLSCWSQEDHRTWGWLQDIWDAVYPYRNNRSQMLFKTGLLKNSAIFIQKHLYWSLFLIKLQAWWPATLLKRVSNTGVFLRILWNF